MLYLSVPLWVNVYRPELHRDLNYDVVEEFDASAEKIDLEFPLLEDRRGLRELALLQHHYCDWKRSPCDRSQS